MSSQAKVVIGGVVVGVLALWLLPSLFKLLVVALIAVPVIGYLMLDSTQRRKVRGHARKSLRG